jgi:NADP-dependent aldehyde dehydrogenase
MPITGRLIIGFDTVAAEPTFRGRDPVSGVPLDPPFASASIVHVERACRSAASAFNPYREAPLALRAKFLRDCADNLLGLGEEWLERAARETGLSRTRLEGERARTVGQLQMFADHVLQGEFLGVRLDPALPGRKPLPRPDLRRRRIPLGPVAVFGASNFPLAFSAAGGDVAAALAAGCPVVVKAHPAHPGTSELAAGAISAAARACELPSGTYSHLSGPSNDLGAALVMHPAIKAVGFTGSRAGGLALVKLAGMRCEPIPVFAEMSSINPVLILPAALRARGRPLAQRFVDSLTLGVGQFCTNPGLVLALEGADLDGFVEAASTALAEAAPGQMLTAGISGNYRRGVERLRAHAGVSQVGSGRAGTDREACAALFKVSAKNFLADASLAEEVFGPSCLVVGCKDLCELHDVVRSLEGQLTATMQLDPDDYTAAATLLPTLEQKAGRILVNGWPTGVEVSPAMVHGGPYPATSDSRSSSVGTLAIERFLRPVCYQDMPETLLPSELRSNPR